MSQPPYGHPQLPPPPGAGGSPYGYGPPQPPPPPPGPDHTLRTVLLVVGAVVLVLGGLLAWFIISIINGAERIGSQFDTNYRGSSSSPLTVAEGEAFSIRGFDYAAGWAVEPGSRTSIVSGLEATNKRGDGASSRADLRVTLLNGNEIVDQFTCRADATVSFGRSTALDCGSLVDVPADYDTIEVNATAFFP